MDERGLQESFTWISDSNQPENIIPALDLLIHPARREPFGRIICEAMAAGVPVLAANTCGPSAIITDNETGRLAADGKVETFTKIAVELLQTPEECIRLTANARQHVQEKYSVSRVCRELTNIYDNISRAVKENREYKPDKY